MALAAALGLVALLGVLIAGALASSIAARRAAWLSQSDAALTAGADYALGAVLADWQESLLADLPLGVPRVFESTIMQSAPVHATTVATRLPDDLLWLVADARTDRLDHGRRRFGLIARFGVPGPPPPAAIVARGAVGLGDVKVSSDSAGDADCAPPAGGADILVAPGAAWTANDSVRVSIDGRALDSATYFLAARQRPWLDSAVALRHVAGDTTIAGGSYQGILLVDGSLRITKPFAATGLVIARGSVEAIDTVSIVGAMLSFATAPQTAMSLSSGVVRYAPCVIARMLRRASPPRPVHARSWSEIF